MLNYFIREDLKTQKINIYYLQKDQKSHLAFITSTAFNISNFYHHIKRCLKSYFLFNYF